MSWTNDGFCRYAHARVITDFKNMANYMKSEHWLKASEKAKTKTRITAAFNLFTVNLKKLTKNLFSCIVNISKPFMQVIGRILYQI